MSKSYPNRQVAGCQAQLPDRQAIKAAQGLGRRNSTLRPGWDRSTADLLRRRSPGCPTKSAQAQFRGRPMASDITLTVGDRTPLASSGWSPLRRCRL